MAIVRGWRATARRRWFPVWLLHRRAMVAVAAMAATERALPDERQPGMAATGAADDLEAFEALLRGRERDVFGYLWRLTGDEQTAYDLCQETFLRAWQHFGKIRHYEQPGAWLFRVATNLAAHHRERRATASSHQRDVEVDMTALVADDAAARLAQTDLVRRTLLRLSLRQRAALVLREVYGCSNGEIAEALRLSSGAVKMTLLRAREAFRREYAREEGR